MLKKLGYAREREGIAYLWPEKGRAKRRPPLVLRLIEASGGRRPVYLLTSVLGSRRLSDAAAAALYKRRWGVELLYRSLKQTMGRRKMLSDSPAHAEAELDWTVVGFWVLTVTSASAAGVAARASPATALRIIRRAAAGRARTLSLAAAVQDGYERSGGKAARRWPHKKNEKPPGVPKARDANPAEVRLAKEIRRLNKAA